ncbi:hypothetical protein CEP53_013433 [Fusarium sp. AF-6]|nr:hypothetical protein CEP53_013433 [Fusarium sp. AF-6]
MPCTPNLRVSTIVSPWPPADASSLYTLARPNMLMVMNMGASLPNMLATSGQWRWLPSSSIIRPASTSIQACHNRGLDRCPFTAQPQHVLYSPELIINRRDGTSSFGYN